MSSKRGGKKKEKVPVGLPDRGKKKTENRRAIIEYTWDSIQSMTRDFSDVLGDDQGNFSDIFDGNLVTGQRVAVKLYEIAQTKHQYEAEKEAYGMFDHPNIVHVYGFCDRGVYKEKERAAIVMQYAPGDLHRRIEGDGNISIQKLIEIIKQIASVTEYLNSRGYIHGELKPKNLLFDMSDNIRLCDFGGFNEVGKIMATRDECYSAPELLDKAISTATSDVFSFGVIVLQMLDRQNEDQVKNVPKDKYDWDKQCKIKFKRFNESHISVRCRQLVEQGRDAWFHEGLKTGDKKLDKYYADFFINLGYSCTKFYHNQRITISEVIQKLSTLKLQ